jgi:hypothetical protein
MRRRLLTLALLGCGLVLAAPVAAEVVQKGDVRVVLNGNFSPQALPREHLAPVEVSVESRIMTTGGGAPPPLRVFEIALNRHGRIFVQGLGICHAPELQSASTERALARCRGALVGEGRFEALLSFGSQTDVSSAGRVLVFNARQEGKPALLLHFYVRSPVEGTLVLPLRIEHRRRGDFGFVLRTKVPKIAGDVGSITGIKLTIGRRFSYRGTSRSYLLASCAAPAGFSGGPFPFLRGTFSFADNQRIDTTLIRSCRVR